MLTTTPLSYPALHPHHILCTDACKSDQSWTNPNQPDPVYALETMLRGSKKYLPGAISMTPIKYRNICHYLTANDLIYDKINTLYNI